MSIVLNNIQKRFLFFLGICIPLRAILTYLAKVIKVKYLPYLGLFYLIFGLSMIYLFLTKSRLKRDWMKDDIWWKNLRPLHGFLYVLFAYLAFNKNENAWLVLLFDTIFGLIAFTIHHYSIGSFIKLI